MDFVGDETADDRAKNADGGDEHSAVAARFFGKNFGNQRDAATEFASKPKTRDETPEAVGFDGMDKAIGDVRNGIKQDGTEENGQSAKTVAEYSECNSAKQHSEHLQIKQMNSLRENLVAGKTQVFQARAAHDGEQNQIVNVHEIAERADDDGGLEDFAKGGFLGFHFTICAVLFFES